MVSSRALGAEACLRRSSARSSRRVKGSSGKNSASRAGTPLHTQSTRSTPSARDVRRVSTSRNALVHIVREASPGNPLARPPRGPYKHVRRARERFPRRRPKRRRRGAPAGARANGPKGGPGRAETRVPPSGESMSPGRARPRSSEAVEEVRNPRRAGASFERRRRFPFTPTLRGPRRAQGRLCVGPRSREKERRREAARAGPHEGRIPPTGTNDRFNRRSSGPTRRRGREVPVFAPDARASARRGAAVLGCGGSREVPRGGGRRLWRGAKPRRARPLPRVTPVGFGGAHFAGG